MTPHIEMTRKMTIDNLIDELKTALREFWERDDDDAAFDEDILPEYRKNTANAAIIERAKYDLEKRTLKQLHPLIGESRHAHSMRASMIGHYLDDAADAVQAYFDDVVYRLQS